MRKRVKGAARAVFLLAALGATTGCVAAVAAAAGAGAGAGVYLTTRGASSLANGSLDALAERTLAVFRDAGVQRTATETQEDGSGRTYRGFADGMEISVKLEREGASVTRVTVYARRSTVEWDREYARELLQRIVTRG